MKYCCISLVEEPKLASIPPGGSLGPNDEVVRLPGSPLRKIRTASFKPNSGKPIRSLVLGADTTLFDQIIFKNVQKSSSAVDDISSSGSGVSKEQMPTAFLR
jgi:hypothetical protein